jgi:hypothetical protein
MAGEIHTSGFGLSEQELRHGIEEELLRAMHVEGDRPTVHAIAHSVARVLDEDHLRMREQLEQAGVDLGAGGSRDTPTAGAGRRDS